VNITHLALQHNQLISERGILRLKVGSFKTE
jgi:hypothetical protein